MTDAGVVLVVDPSREAADVAGRLDEEFEETDVVTAEDVSDGVTVVRRRRVECVVSAYDVPDERDDGNRGTATLLDRVRAHDPNVPFVAYADRRGDDAGDHSIDRSNTAYVPRTSPSGSYDRLVSRVRRLVERSRSLDERGSNHRITALISDVSQALVRAWSRSDVEAVTCDRLARGEPYRYALLGDVTDGRVRIRTSAGIGPPGGEDLEATFGHEAAIGDVFRTAREARGVDSPEDPADSRITEPDERSEPDRHAWSGNVESGRRSNALAVAERTRTGLDPDGAVPSETLGAVPVTQKSTVYGTLVVGTTRRDPFGLAERRALVRFGETVGHAIRASRTRERLEEHERRLERQNERLQHFARMVSHDLRNPLQVVLGRLGVIEADIDDEDYESMRSAINRMSALIDDVLRLVDGGTNRVDPVPVELGTVAMDAWRATANGEALRIDDAVAVEADASLLEQLLANLFQNAVDHAGPDVTVRVEPIENGFAVEDDGPGIPESERGKVFELGYSAEGTSTGYGLAIVSEIVAAHGWKIGLDGGDESGARFEITGVDRPH